MPNRVVFVCLNSPFRTTAPADVLTAFSPEVLQRDRVSITVDFRHFGHLVERGDWSGQIRFIRNEVARVQAAVDEVASTEAHVFGIVEVPQAIALGAFLSDERTVQYHPFDRTTGRWGWPADGQPIEFDTLGKPEGSAIRASGVAVLRLETSGPVEDQYVDETVSAGSVLADVTVRARVSTLQPGRLSSPESLVALERELRTAVAAIVAKHPHLTTIHVFANAGIPECLVLGKVLRPRNTVPVQTYRFRQRQDGPSYTEALLITGTGQDEVTPAELTSDQVAAARVVRIDLWPQALSEVRGLAARLASDLEAAWYSHLAHRELLHSARVFPPLPPLTQLVPPDSSVDPEPFPGTEYGYDKERRLWRVSDPLACRLWEAGKNDIDRCLRLLRLFLFHEHLHEHHSLTKYTAREVGKFPNCLEHVDYTADTYALMHELEFALWSGELDSADERAQHRFLETLIEQVVASFWVFEPEGVDAVEWQVRRVRRYLNWYWRQVQVRRADTLEHAIRLFRRQPNIEIAGLQQFVRGHRHFVRLDRRDQTVHLELAIVLENEELVRVGPDATTNLDELLTAFQQKRHDEIVDFFRSLYEKVDRDGAAQAQRV